MKKLRNFTELTEGEKQLVNTGPDELLLPMLIRNWINRDITDRLFFEVADDRLDDLKQELKSIARKYEAEGISGRLLELTQMITAYSVITKQLLRADSDNHAGYTRRHLAAAMLPPIEGLSSLFPLHHADRVEGRQVSLETAIAVETIRHAGRKWLLKQGSFSTVEDKCTEVIASIIDTRSSDADKDVSNSQLRHVPAIFDELTHWRTLETIINETGMQNLAERLQLNHTIGAARCETVYRGL